MVNHSLREILGLAALPYIYLYLSTNIRNHESKSQPHEVYKPRMSHQLHSIHIPIYCLILKHMTFLY